MGLGTCTHHLTNIQVKQKKERCMLESALTALEGNIGVETFKSGRAMVDPTDRLVMTTSC